jgi:hypothetical protein
MRGEGVIGDHPGLGNVPTDRVDRGSDDGAIAVSNSGPEIVKP